MFNNDLSYLYSNECLTSSNSNEKELSKFSPDRTSNTRLYQRIGPVLSLRHRSKHILLFREDVHQNDKRREKNRIAARRLREKRQLFERNLRKKIQQLEDKQSYLENDLKQYEAYKQALQTEINNKFSLNTLLELLLIPKDKIPLALNQYSDDFELSSNISTASNDIDFNFDS